MSQLIHSSVGSLQVIECLQVYNNILKFRTRRCVRSNLGILQTGQETFGQGQLLSGRVKLEELKKQHYSFWNSDLPLLGIIIY